MRMMPGLPCADIATHESDADVPAAALSLYSSRRQQPLGDKIRNHHRIGIKPFPVCKRSIMARKQLARSVPPRNAGLKNGLLVRCLVGLKAHNGDLGGK